MREFRTSGSVGAPGGNPRGHPTGATNARCAARLRRSRRYTTADCPARDGELSRPPASGAASVPIRRRARVRSV